MNNMMEIIKMTLSKAKVNTNIKMALYMMEIGKRVKKMVMVN